MTALATIEVRVPQVLAVTANPSLTIDKTANRPVVNRGSVVEYTVVVTNAGEATAVNVRVEDLLPAGFTFVTGGSEQTFVLGNLEPGQSERLTYRVQVGKGVRVGNYDNLATAQADNAPPVSAKARVTVRTVKVLPATGPGLMDLLFAGLGLLFWLSGVAGLRFARGLRRWGIG